jgi:hypothetical protein
MKETCKIHFYCTCHHHSPNQFIIITTTTFCYIFLNWSTCMQCIPLLKYMYTMYSFIEVHVYNVFLNWSTCTCIQCIPVIYKKCIRPPCSSWVGLNYLIYHPCSHWSSSVIDIKKWKICQTVKTRPEID